MDLNEFRAAAAILLGSEANEIRRQYIQSFVDTTTSYYRERIAVTRAFRDGQCYVGYLWDSLKHSRLVDEEEAIKELARMAKPLYALWDIHSNERIYIKDYWKFPKDAVLILGVKELIAGMRFLPEDIYVFDDSFDWSIVFTHEYYGDQQRDCRIATSEARRGSCAALRSGAKR